jgi:hypothetical protein
MAKAELARTRQLIKAAVLILSNEWPMTIRQLFYRLVSARYVENDRSDYQRVSRVMTSARDDGRCRFEWIVDRSRPEYSPNVFDDATGYAEAVKRSYRKDYWATQPNHCELWVEKDAIIGSIQDVTNELGITVRVGRGFLSTTKAYEIAMRFNEISKPITIYYLGDQDPSGRNIETDLAARIRGYGSSPFTLKRLAIHASDIRKFKLPPLRVKTSDSRAKRFLEKYGNTCVELDALPPGELRRRVREAVELLLNRTVWDRAVEIEKIEIASIRGTVERWPRSTSGIDQHTGGV